MRTSFAPQIDTCISYLQDKVAKGFDSGLLTGMILIDLQKAFNTIDHEILIEKVKCACHVIFLGECLV